MRATGIRLATPCGVDMIRPLLALLLAIALLPLEIPSGSTGSAGSRGGGTTGGRPPPPPATPPPPKWWEGISAPPQSAHSHEAVQCAVPPRFSLHAEHASRRHRSSP